MRTSTRSIILMIMTVLFLALLVACATHQSLTQKHPVAVTDEPKCSDCHTDGRAALDHGADFITRHQFYASQQSRTCSLCHNESFCADCHANKEELKPSDKYKDSPARVMPHRGDYLTQHKIDGKLNPASCFPCHGRQNNERCKLCHR